MAVPPDPLAGQGRFPARLSAADSLLWHIERDPVLRSPVVAIGLLDRPPPWDEVRATVTRAVARVPRLRQRVAPAGPAGRWLSWVDDPDFSLDRHVGHVRVPHGGDFDDVLALAAPGASDAFDPTRPLWTSSLVEGLPGGRAAFVLRFHHAMADGVGSIDLAAAVFDASPDGATAAAAEPGPAGVGPAAPAGPWWSVPARLAAPSITAAGAGLDAARHPGRTVTGGARVVRSVGRMLAPATEALSPLLRGRGLNRSLAVLEYPMADLRRTARAVDATLNEVFLAAVAGALFDYHVLGRQPVPALRFTMPVNVRSAGDPPGGNRFTPVRFCLRIDAPDPLGRVAQARATSRRGRAEPAVGLTALVAAGVDLLPAAVATRLFGAMLKNVDASASNVPGLGQPAYLGGAEILRLWGFAPPVGAALAVTLVSHVDTACVGVVADTAAVADPGLLADCLERAFEELIGAGAARASDAG